MPCFMESCFLLGVKSVHDWMNNYLRDQQQQQSEDGSSTRPASAVGVDFVIEVFEGSRTQDFPNLTRGGTSSNNNNNNSTSNSSALASRHLERVLFWFSSLVLSVVICLYQFISLGDLP